jgi:hypothetical protein
MNSASGPHAQTLHQCRSLAEGRRGCNAAGGSKGVDFGIAGESVRGRRHRDRFLGLRGLVDRFSLLAADGDRAERSDRGPPASGLPNNAGLLIEFRKWSYPIHPPSPRIMRG